MATATRENLGYLLAKRRSWNEVLQEGFAEAGYPEVRASYGSVLLPLLEEDGLRMGEIAHRARLSKQTMTTMGDSASATAWSSAGPTATTVVRRAFT